MELGPAFDRTPPQKSLQEGKARRPSDLLELQSSPSSLEQKIQLTPELFKSLDTDNSGAIDVAELKAIFPNKIFVPDEMDEFGVDVTADVFFKRADLDGNGRLDYAEYERLMNMQKNGDAQGGLAPCRWRGFAPCRQQGFRSCWVCHLPQDVEGLPRSRAQAWPPGNACRPWMARLGVPTALPRIS